MPDITSAFQEKDLKAIQMRYEGVLYKDIAEYLGIQTSTVRVHFSKGGRLYEHYNQYVAEMSKKSVHEAAQKFKGFASKSAKALTEIFDRNMKDMRRLKKLLKNTKDLDLKKTIRHELRTVENRVVELSERMLDRGGLAIIRRLETSDNKNGFNDEEEVGIDERLRSMGVDPNKITRPSKAPAPTN